MRQDKSRPLQTHLKSPKDQLTKHFWLIAKKTNRKTRRKRKYVKPREKRMHSSLYARNFTSKS